MLVDRAKEREPSYCPEANKKTKVNIQNSFREPPPAYLKGIRVKTMHLEGIPGYTP